MAAATQRPNKITFSNVQRIDDRTYKFTVSPIHVTYANTLRRLILTGIKSVGFRADMTTEGTTTDVKVIKNDTPMTNEMLAHRIGLLPINIKNPSVWDSDRYRFELKVTCPPHKMMDVCAGDFKVYEKKIGTDGQEYEEELSTNLFFPPDPVTGDTCLIATLRSDDHPQEIHIVAKATTGTGRENARFIPVSQCSYMYTLDTDEDRRKEMFNNWMQNAKKASDLEEDSPKYQAYLREFNTMEVSRCYLMDDTGEPYSFDFTIETVGVLDVPYIVQAACEFGAVMCDRFSNVATDTKLDTTPELSISKTETSVIGWDFLFKGHDHTLGNLLQTWLEQHHMENGDATPTIIYTGYSVPHPLRDEMILRIGVADKTRDGTAIPIKEGVAREALSAASRGCAELFRSIRGAWLSSQGIAAPVMQPAVSAPKKKAAPLRRSTPSK